MKLYKCFSLKLSIFQNSQYWLGVFAAIFDCARCRMMSETVLEAEDVWHLTCSFGSANAKTDVTGVVLDC